MNREKKENVENTIWMVFMATASVPVCLCKLS